MSALVWLETLWPHLLAVTTLAMAVLAILHLVLTKRNVRATIGWTGLIALVPILGTILYLILGINRIQRQAVELRSTRRTRPPSQIPTLDEELVAWIIEDLPADVEYLGGLSRLSAHVVELPLLRGNSFELLRDGDQAYPAMLEAIAQAERTITLSTYIFDNDEVGVEFVEALSEAVERGVAVHVLVDSVGARYTFPSIFFALRKAKVPAASFLPILVPWRAAFWNLRTHRKIMVVDGEVGFTGGINLRVGHCIEREPRRPVRDTHFRLMGPIVCYLQQAFAEDWLFTTGETLRGEDYFAPPSEAGEAIARGIPDGPDEDFENLLWVLLGALAEAEEHVCIVTPYFLPEDALLHALQTAAMRGVTVEIFLPERSNLPFVDWASITTWGRLLRSGCRIWLAPEPFDHSKLMVVDGSWSLIGSANWDARSLELNFEFNVECYDESLASDILELIEAKRAISRELTVDEHHERGQLERFRNGLVRLLSPYL